jgi:hypothetical protein
MDCGTSDGSLAPRLLLPAARFQPSLMNAREGCPP